MSLSTKNNMPLQFAENVVHEHTPADVARAPPMVINTPEQITHGKRSA